MVDISILIVSWRVRELVRRCLESLGATDGTRAEIILVDNASNDGTVAMAHESFPNVHCIANGVNRGFAAANNQALSRATGRYMLLLNPDTEVRPGTVAQVVSYLDAHPDVGLFGSTILNPDGTLQRSVRRFPSLLTLAALLLKLHALFPDAPPVRSYFANDFDYDHEADVDQLMGAYLVVRREALHDIGMLDAGYYLWFEEVDWCKRARDAGWKVRYAPGMPIIHRGGESFRQHGNARQQLLFVKSALRYARKHFSPYAYAALVALAPLSLALGVLEPLIRRFYVPRAAH